MLLTTWPLPQALHDHVQLRKRQHPVLVFVEQHENLLELSNHLVRQLPLALEQEREVRTHAT